MYNKIFSKIVDSSIWLESTPTRIVWLMFIAVMDEAGFVQFASVRNVAHRARVTEDEAQEAIVTLEGPDTESSDDANEGRRIERVPGGWLVLNAEKYRVLVTRAVIQEQTRERVRKHRAKKRESVTPNVVVTPSDTNTEVQVQKTSVTSFVNPRHPHRFPHFWCGVIFCVTEEQHFKFTQRTQAAGVDPNELDWPDWYTKKDEEWGEIDIPDREPKGPMFWLAVKLGDEIDLMRHDAAHAS